MCQTPVATCHLSSPCLRHLSCGSKPLFLPTGLEIMNPMVPLERLGGSRQKRDTRALPSSSRVLRACSLGSHQGLIFWERCSVSASLLFFTIKGKQSSAGMHTGFLLEALGFTEALCLLYWKGGAGYVEEFQMLTQTIMNPVSLLGKVTTRIPCISSS